MFKRVIATLICVTFSFTNLQYVQAQDFSINQLPVPGTMVGETAPFAPLALKGLIVNPQKPLEFQFIVDTSHGPQDAASVKDQANQLVKYFLAGLTIPEGDLWVNLSPYEKNRMVPAALGQTDLGRDLLAQDYILKQLTASLIYPEKDLGKEFWSRVYAKAQAQFGTTNIPVNTFNKVWILPDQAQVFENVNAAYVTKSTLKVMLDEDYLAKQKHQATQASSISSQIVRQIILPEIEKEVNTGKNFAPLRQIYQALILAKWYKETIQNGLLDALYTNKNKVAGVNLNDPAVKEQIYNRYLQAYKKGAFNYIKEDPTPDGQVVPRKYFSGGTLLKIDHLDKTPSNRAMLAKGWVAGALFLIAVGLVSVGNPASAQYNLASYMIFQVQAPPDQTLPVNKQQVDEMVRAVMGGNLKKVQAALNSNLDINGFYNKDGLTLLMAAIYFGQNEIVKFLIDKGADVNAKANNGGTSLILASLKGHEDVVKILLAKGADVNAKTNEGLTALSAARYKEHQGIVRILKAAGAKDNAMLNSNDSAMLDQMPSLTNVMGISEQKFNIRPEGEDAAMNATMKIFTTFALTVGLMMGPLGNAQTLPGDKNVPSASIVAVNDVKQRAIDEMVMAATLGDLTKVQTALNFKLDINGFNSKGITALMAAAYDEQEEMIKFLIAKGADTNAKNNEGKTALMMAFRFYNKKVKETVELLLAKGADVNKKDNNGWTALIYASLLGENEIVEQLLAKGADANANDGTALMVASEYGFKKIVESLLKKGVDVNETDNNGWTALIQASASGQKDVVELLLAKGADVDANGGMALMVASEYGFKEIVELLLKKGVDVNEADNNGWTALIRASGSGRKDVVKLLLAKGANVNAEYFDGTTALMGASGKGYMEIVEQLLAKGADVNVKRADGMTALSLAIKYGHQDIVKILKAAGADDAMLQTSKNGGIDLNQINVLRNGKTVNVQFDTAQLNALEQGGFEGFTPVIINITHISSPFQLLGVNTAKEQLLAKA